MTEIQNRLFELRDPKYAAFQSKLIPTLDPSLVIGVRIPVVRQYAKQLFKNNPDETYKFLSLLPHKYYDENILHDLLLNQIKDFDKCIGYVESFLPYIDNWAVNDSLKPQCFKKYRLELLAKIKIWLTSNHTYTIRFGILMLMTHFLDEDYSTEILELVASVKSEEYYVNMMIAWFFATSVCKHWEQTLKYLDGKKLSIWTTNKAIQKSIESFCVSDQQKSILREIKKSV